MSEGGIYHLIVDAVGIVSPFFSWLFSVYQLQQRLLVFMRVSFGGKMNATIPMTKTVEYIVC